MRPMPGAARMYPETDVPPIRIEPGRWQAILGNLPAKPEERVAGFVKQYGLSEDLAKQVVAEGVEMEFAGLASAGAESALAARVLLHYLPGLQHADAVAARLPELFAQLTANKFAKEAVEPLVKALDAAPKAPLADLIAILGLGAADTKEVDAVIARVVASQRDLIKAKGAAAMGPLMGPIMAELRGKADGAVISARLKAALDQVK
jgi:glutamyl-tRNA(Gln) amidotransferase subunit E